MIINDASKHFHGIILHGKIRFFLKTKHHFFYYTLSIGNIQQKIKKNLKREIEKPSSKGRLSILLFFRKSL